MSAHLRILCGLGLASLMTAATAPALAQTRTYLNADAGLGYSTNPELRLDGARSGYGRVSLFGFHGWGGERSQSSLSAYVENTFYFRRYSSRQVFDVNATTSRDVSETVRLFGNLGISGDFGAQLSSRFYGAPVDSAPVTPAPIDNAVIVINPDLTALNQRQYRINGRAGANFVLSARDSLVTTVGGQRVFFSSNGDSLNYYYYDATAGYQRQLNARAGIGVRVIGTYADYKLGRSITSYGPQLTGNLKLSESVEAVGAVGFVRTEQDLGSLGGSDNSINLAFDGSICRKLTNDRLCARFSQRTQSSVLGTAPTSSSVNLDYSRRLGARDEIQGAFALVTTGGERNLGFGRQTFYTVSSAYNHRISDRISAGVNLAARKLYTTGPNPRADVGGSVFIRTRFGSIL